MILKVVRDLGDGKNPAQEVVIECDRYNRRGADETDSKMSNVESMFGDLAGEVNPTVFLTLMKGDRNYNMRVIAYLLLGHATVFVMNNDGKTVDTIHA